MVELLKEIWSTARRNKLRTSLTGFAVAWGIFMIIFLLGAGNGLINAQLQQTDRHLASSMQVYGGVTSMAHKGLREGRWIKLNDDDIDITGKLFSEHVEEVGGCLQQYELDISYGEEYVSSQHLCGVSPADATINRRKLLCGRFVNELDMRERRKTVVLTESQAKELAPGRVQTLLGRYVKVGALSFKVVGILQDESNGENRIAYTAYSTVKTIYAKGEEAGYLQVALRNLETKEKNEAFEKEYRAAISRHHDASPDDNSALWIWNRLSGNMQMLDGIRMIRTALWVIGILTLLSGVVGVSNIMLITVKERTREFGVRKAIGAKPWHILQLILTESVITTAFFGYVGMLCGVAANAYMDATIGREVVDSGLFQVTIFVNPTVGLDVCVQVTLVIIVAGTLAGLTPALKAARVRPIEALRAD